MRRAGSPDLTSLVAGIAVTLLGTLLLLDQLDALHLRLGIIAPLVCAVLGATLVASGLSRRG